VQVGETCGTAPEKTGTRKVIQFKKCIVASGSQAVRLPFMSDAPRIADSTSALELEEAPKRMLILGGLHHRPGMGAAYSILGVRLDVVEMMDGLMQGADRYFVKVW
jgi:dihydrolipoamide dehydrogenase